MRWTNTIVTSKLSTQEELAIPLSMNTQTHTHTEDDFPNVCMVMH